MNTEVKTGVVYAAYAAAILFAIHLVTYFIAPLRDATTTSSPIVAELLALLAVVEHLLVFPIVAALPAPRWAKAAGYGWLVIDIATDIMQLNGVPKTTYLAMRYGGHISAALCILTQDILDICWHSLLAEASCCPDKMASCLILRLSIIQTEQ